jgi:hypothetical protein
MRSLLWITLLLAGCEKDLLADMDAAVDASGPDAAIPAGLFYCVGKPLRLAAPDPVSVAGKAYGPGGGEVASAAVEVYKLEDSTLLGQGTTASAPNTIGRYGVSVGTGGVAPSTYRKLAKDGLVETYLIDAFPLFFTPAEIDLTMLNPAELAGYYAAVGVTADPSKSTIFVTTLDCPDQTGATRVVQGTTIAAPAAEKIVYVGKDGNFDLAATSSPSGHAVIFNAPVGPFDMTVSAGPYTYRAWPLFGRAGAFIYAPVSP